MTTDATAADSNFLTIDQAVANLDAAEPEEQEEQAPAAAAKPEGQNTEAEPAAEDASEPEAATDGEDAETEDGETEAEEAEQSAIEPPRFWDAEAKKRFSELPRDLQELVLSKETERDKATSKAIEEAALKRKAADGEASKITQLSGVLDKLIPQAVETFNSRWKNVDWNAVVDQYGAGEALKLRNQFEAEMRTVQQLETAKAEADQIQHAKFVETESAKLREVCPDLLDPKDGPTRRTELAQFLVSSGVPAEVLNQITAAQTSIAYDAMRWRNAQAKAQSQASAPKTPAQTKPATPAKPSVKATAAPARSGSPQSARINALKSKSVLTIDEGVELMDLQET